MRIWDIAAGYLSRQSLLGEHREVHALYVILSQGRAGYAHHPETRRWRALELMRFPELKTVPESEMQEVAVVKVMPEVISLLDYTKGFGHTELVRV